MSDDLTWEDVGRTPDGRIIIRPVMRRKPRPPPIACLICRQEQDHTAFLMASFPICWSCYQIRRQRLYLKKGLTWSEQLRCDYVLVAIAHLEREIEQQRKPR